MIMTPSEAVNEQCDINVLSMNKIKQASLRPTFPARLSVPCVRLS